MNIKKNGNHLISAWFRCLNYTQGCSSKFIAKLRQDFLAWDIESITSIHVYDQVSKNDEAGKPERRKHPKLSRIGSVRFGLEDYVPRYYLQKQIEQIASPYAKKTASEKDSTIVQTHCIHFHDKTAERLGKRKRIETLILPNYSDGCPIRSCPARQIVRVPLPITSTMCNIMSSANRSSLDAVEFYKEITQIWMEAIQ